MQSTFKNEKDIKIVRNWLIFFMVALFVSGLTAIPVIWELEWLTRFFSIDTPIGYWLDKVHIAAKETGSKYPFLFYGYDWLAFAHFILAFLFIGPYRNPVKNIWVIEFGIYACLLIIPFAFIAGHFRGIPLLWRITDCSFGVFGLIPLIACYRKIRLLADNPIEEDTLHNPSHQRETRNAGFENINY